MTESKKVLLDKARSHLDHCAKVLKANEILWNDRWKAQPNAFVQIVDYTSEEQRARRKPIIDAWIEARNKYDELNA
jgi:acyl carrier protein phosphodiesterase